jgi:hypothetical protein
VTRGLYQAYQRAGVTACYRHVGYAGVCRREMQKRDTEHVCRRGELESGAEETKKSFRSCRRPYLAESKFGFKESFALL